MNKEVLYTFYADEDIESELKTNLDIQEDFTKSSIGNEEFSTLPLKEQLKNVKWSELGIGKYCILFYLSCKRDEKNDCIRKSFEKVHIIRRHYTKEEIAERVKDNIKNTLTTLNDCEII